MSENKDSQSTRAAPVRTEQDRARAERSAALATLAITREEERSERENDEKHERNSASVVASRDIVDSVKLRVGGVFFEVEKSTLLRFRNTFFHGLFSSGAWQPEADGAYFIDRPVMGFDRILEYLSSGELSVEGLSEEEENCMYSSLDFLLIPYKRQWKYNTRSVLEGLTAWYVRELKDGRLCGANRNDIIVWNTDSNGSEITMEGHTNNINRVIQLQDGRVCTCSDDRTIKLWSIDSGLCKLTITGHTRWVMCIIQLVDGRVCSGSYDETSILQLFDGRLCSGSWDGTIRVWSASTGVCEMTMITEFTVYCIVQLADGRICCCGGYGGSISIYSLLTGECELSWEGHTDWVRAILCIDATRVCSGSSDRTIKVWSTATGECERTLEGHTDSVYSMVLMQDGRLCSGSYDGTLKLWNLETGECEKTLDTKNKCRRVLQLEDGRLLSILYNASRNEYCIASYS